MRIHSLLSPKCHARQSSVNGMGVFATQAFAERELVAVWGGKIYTAEECERLGSVFSHCVTHPVALCKGYFLGSENLFEFDDAELFNHSCDPNIGVQGQVVLLARRPISPGEELLIDYGTLDDSPYDFDCQCGTKHCRGQLRGDMWREDEFRNRHRGYLSWYLEELVRTQTYSTSREGRMGQTVIKSPSDIAE